MPDFDVAAVSLASPPSLGALTTYRPAVLVRNNGIHDALASGYVRAYKAGRLVFESEVYSPTIPPGETRQATAVGYWTPDAVGSYMFQGFVTTPKDSVPSNNQLAPVTITITAVEPPPPPIVTVHASQHEEGGDDEVSIDGLRGLAADEQHPRDHASNHEAGGDDELSVDGLAGTLATPQPTAQHANEKHTVPFSTVAEMTNHQGALAAHNDAQNLEKVSRKGAANGYAPLGSDSLIPATYLPPSGVVAPHASSHETFGADVLNVGGLSGVLADAQTAAAHAASHAPGAADEIATAAPLTLRPMNLDDIGTSTALAKADHRHRTPGGAAAGTWGYVSGPTELMTKNVPAGFFAEGYVYVVRLTACFRWATSPATFLRLTLSYRAGLQPAVIIGEIVTNFLYPSAQDTPLKAEIIAAIQGAPVQTDYTQYNAELRWVPVGGLVFSNMVRGDVGRFDPRLPGRFIVTADQNSGQTCMFDPTILELAADKCTPTEPLQLFDVAAVNMSHTMPAQVGTPIGVDSTAQNVGTVTADNVQIRVVILDPIGGVAHDSTSPLKRINVGQTSSYGIGFTPTMPGSYAATATIIYPEDENSANDQYALSIFVAP